MSEEVRNQALNPAISCLVQAPAGSGKTELLTRRILTLLALVDEPEEILALTFTRKAASEMRNRVIKALAMEKPGDETSHDMISWQLVQRVLQRSKQRGWNLSEYPARLRIMTLDSLCSTLARQLPLLSGLGDMPKPVEYASALYYEAAEKALNKSMQDDSQAVETLLLHQDHNTHAVIELIAKMLANRDQWIKYITDHSRDTGKLKAIIQSNLSLYIAHQLTRCDELIPAEIKLTLPSLISFSGSQLNDNEFSQITAWPACDTKLLPLWKYVANFLLTDKGVTFRKTITKNQGFPSSAKEEKQKMLSVLSVLSDISGLDEALHAIRSMPDSSEFDPWQWQIVESMFLLLPQAVIELESIFSTQNQTDFTGIALRALRALNDIHGNPSDLLLKMDYRIHHILIDEFQDTSELQISLLRCLTSGWQHEDGRTLFMVGDPMQSIYRFRKAEVGLFLQAAQNSAGLPHITELRLERNFRSSPTIVNWVNRAFRCIFPRHQDAISGAISYASAKPALPHSGIVQLHLLKASGNSKNDDQSEAAAIARLVKESVAQGQRVGILARTRKHFHAVMPALTEEGIPFRAINILPLQTRPEIRMLRALIRALLHPADKESWLAMLRSPYCGLRTSDLFTLLHDDDRNIWEILQDKQAIMRLNDDARSRTTHLTHALKPCMAVSGKIKAGELARYAWLRLSIPALLDKTAQDNVDTLFGLIDILDEAGRVDFSLLDKRIEKLYAEPDSSSQAEHVELMTMHGAKGLQWDVVILPCLGKAGRNNDQPLLAFTDVPVDGQAVFLMSPKAETRNSDQLYSLVQSVEKLKENNELARLLYVACTRAKTALYMFGEVSEKNGEARKGSLLQLLYQQGNDCFGAEIFTIDTNKHTGEEQRKSLRRIKKMSLHFPEYVPDTPREPEYGWAGPEAAPVGNTLHAALQKVAEHGIATWNHRHTKQIIDDMKCMLIAEGLSGSVLESAFKRCKDGLTKTLSSKLGQWILSASHEDAHSEWSLIFMQNGQACQRIIDRSFIDEKGVRWIIDYKTGSHEGADLNAFLDSEQQRYTPQLEEYRNLLRKMDSTHPVKMALYFPMFDGWREI